MADGETPEKAVENAQVIIAEWIETALEDGEKGTYEQRILKVAVVRRPFIIEIH